MTHEHSPHVEHRQLEFEAEAIIRASRQSNEYPPRLRPIVDALLGPDAACTSPLTLPGEAALICVRGRWRLYVRPGLSQAALAFAVAHELAEWWLHARVGYTGPDIEDAANYLAAAIIAPRRAYRLARVVHRHDRPGIARAFRASETMIALREGEVMQRPLAVVTPMIVRARPLDWIWPDDKALREMAHSSAPPHGGVRRARLTDDPRRVVLSFAA